MDLAVEVNQLTKTYGTFVAVNGLSLAVKRGEVLGLVRPTGPGKTTTAPPRPGGLPPPQRRLGAPRGFVSPPRPRGSKEGAALQAGRPPPLRLPDRRRASPLRGPALPGRRCRRQSHAAADRIRAAR